MQLTPEEIQQQLDEAFGPWDGMKSHPSPSVPSPSSLRSFRVGKPATGGQSRRQRCDAQVKNLFRIGKNGVRVATRGLFCKGWAMENGRCWVHGGASTGPGTSEGKGRVVAAMVEGRRKWVERRHAEGKKFPAGRKRGEKSVTVTRELARVEARKLRAGRFTLDRSLTLALLRSADGCLESRASEGDFLDAQELAALEQDRQAALARIAELRASLLTGR